MKRALRLVARNQPIVPRKVRRLPGIRRWRPVGLIWRRALELAPHGKVRPNDRSFFNVHHELRFAHQFSIVGPFASFVMAALPASPRTKVIGRHGRPQRQASPWLPVRLSDPIPRKAIELRVADSITRSQFIVGGSVRELLQCFRRRDHRTASIVSTVARELRTRTLTSESRIAKQDAATLQAPAVAAQHWRPHRKTVLQLANNMPAMAARAATLQAAPVRPSDLVWRADPGDGASRPGERAASIPALLEERVERAAEPGWKQFAAQASTASSPLLDAALMDRVAQDVIRRVERRMRIERERRGI